MRQSTTLARPRAFARLLLASGALLLVLMVLSSLPARATAAADAAATPATGARLGLGRKLLDYWGWGGPAYADAGRGTFAYSGLVGMPGSPSVIRPPGFFVSSGPRWGWGRR